MKQFILSVIILLALMMVLMSYKSNMESFEDVKMRPWFGYEPGYGPGWGRKGCCNKASPESISANNQA
jgi:hypothetical protein